MAAIILIFALVGLVFFLKRYKIEGVAALYMNGLAMYHLLIGRGGGTIGPVATGALFFTTGILAILLWFFFPPRDLRNAMPKSLSIPYIILFGLSLVWLLHHFIERGMGTPYQKVEYFKWAYALAWWILALIIGIIFPMSPARFQRFLRAVAVAGLASNSLIVIGYFLGAEDVSGSYGSRYAISEQLGSLTYAITASTSAGALLGGYLVCQEKITTKRIILIIAGLGILAISCILAGTRSSLLIFPIVTLAALGTFKFRYIPIGIALLAAVGAIIVFIVVPLLPEMAASRSLTLESIESGLELRWLLVKEVFNILNVAPVFGRTVGLENIIGLTYSHNFTLQIMVETGILGFALYLMAVAMIAGKWIKLLLDRKSPLFKIAAQLSMLFLPVFIEAHAHSHLMNPRMWLLFAIMAGHSIPRYQYEETMLSEYYPEEEGYAQAI